MKESTLEVRAAEELVEALSGAGRIVVLTGAGMSAESGVPTFRGADGLWEKYRAEDLATPEAFRADPTLVWRWYDWRRTLIAKLRPNPGHEALARWETLFPDFTIVTQNVDGLHSGAGSNNVLELHGNIWKVRCTRERTIHENREAPLATLPPKCPDCGELLRPHIVWFGESLDPDVIGRAIRLSETCDLMLVVGTSAIVYPAASLPSVAAAAGAKVIEVNPDATPLSAQAHLSLRGTAAKVLGAADLILRNRKTPRSGDDR